MSKKTKLPFSMMPVSWGLKGKTRAIAEAEYYYEGEELERVLANIGAETEEEKTIRLALEAISQANKELERQSAQDKIMDKMQNLQKRQKELRKSQLKLELDRRRTSKRRIFKW